MSLADTAAIPHTIELNGTEYEIGELTVADLAQFERHLLDKQKAGIREFFKDLDSVDRLQLIHDAEKVNIFAEMSKMENLQFLLWLALKKTDAKMTIEQAGSLASLANVEIIQNALMGDPANDEEPEKN